MHLKVRPANPKRLVVTLGEVNNDYEIRDASNNVIKLIQDLPIIELNDKILQFNELAIDRHEVFVGMSPVSCD